MFPRAMAGWPITAVAFLLAIFSGAEAATKPDGQLRFQAPSRIETEKGSGKNVEVSKPTERNAKKFGGEPLAFKNDPRTKKKSDKPHIVIAIAENLYETKTTLPAFATNVLENKLGCQTTIVHAHPERRHVVPGFAAAVENADVVVLSVRRRALPRWPADWAIRRRRSVHSARY